MSSDKRQKVIEQSNCSASSLPLFSPIIIKEDQHIFDFTSASDRLVQEKVIEHKEPLKHQQLNFKSLQEIQLSYKPSILSDHCDSNDNEGFIYKYGRPNHEAELYNSLPVMTREKELQTEGAFDVPQLTAQSLLSGEQIQIDNESNGNDLLLSSTRYQIDKIFQQHSEESQELMQNEGKATCFHIKKDYAQSKGSDRSESDDLPNVCNPCFSLQEKCKNFEAVNADLLRKNSQLKEEMAKMVEREKQKLLKERQEDRLKHEAINPYVIKQEFLQKLQYFHRILQKVNILINDYSIDFSSEECQALLQYSLQFKKLDENVLNKDEKQQRKLQIEQIHNKYKKIITNILKNAEEKELKRDIDFKIFISLLVKNNPDPIHSRSNIDMKIQRSRRKSKTYSQKDDTMQVEYFDQMKIIQQNRLKIEWLELNYNREKQNCKHLQDQLKELHQRYRTHTNQLIRQKNVYKHQVSKYSQEFSQIMTKIVKTQSNCLIESQFFTNLSQRIFQISNFIPFEDNDQQNLFAPQNQQELFDMIERIRRFYMKIQAYNLSKENQYQSQKSSFALLLKKLVEENKISSQYLLEEVLSSEEFNKLRYLKELIQSSRRNKKITLQRESFNKNRILKIERTKSFTFQSLCDPQQSHSI